MKAKFSLLFILFFYCNSDFFAQDLTNKEGVPILPAAKDWALGLDATRLIKNADFNFVSSTQALTGKYFLTAHTAYRFSLRLGLNNWTSKEMTLDRVAASSSVVAYPAADKMKENVWKRNSNVIGISFGIEKRRGASRLQGIYGVEGNIFVSTLTDKFTYGNELSVSNTAPVVVDSQGDAMNSPYFGYANNIDSVPAIQGVIGSARILKRTNGLAISVGARAFVGAEFFVLPKLSIGGEFGYALSFSTTGRSVTEMESIGQSNVPGSTGIDVRQTTIDGGTNNHFGFDSDNANSIGGLSASLRINLYF